MKRQLILVFILCVTLPSPVLAEAEEDRIGIRAGVGTDISLGLGFGGGINYYFVDEQIEIGAELYIHSSTEESSEYGNTYEESTDLLALALFANYLFGYSRDEGGLYALAGMGLAYLSVEWEESSPTDTSLGTPLPGGGSSQSADGSTAGLILNPGVGISFPVGVDVRLCAPLIVPFGAPGDTSVVIPTLTLTLGYRF